MIIIQKLSPKNHHFDFLRQTMVENQLRPNHLIDGRILHAFSSIPRHDYVFEQQKHISYSDQMIPLKSGRMMLPPLTLANLMQGMQLKQFQKILVVGCGLGYSVQILKDMGLIVFGIDYPLLINLAIKKKPDLDGRLIASPFINGYMNEAPFDAIMIEGGIMQIPHFLVKQLKEGGMFGSLIFEENKRTYKGTIFQKKEESLLPISYFDTVGYLISEFSLLKDFNF